MKCDVFTPENISKKMSSFFIGRNGSLLEPSIGEGSLLKYLSLENFNITGCDINDKYLEVCKKKYDITYIHDNFITREFDKFDNIIMNPPYISSKNINPNDREYIKKTWDILKHGNIDIFYVFIIKGCELLNNGGLLVALIPNNILYNKSAYYIRKYLFDNTLIKNIIDFENNKLFKNVSTHSCIMVLEKSHKDNFLYNDKEFNYSRNFKDYNIFLSPMEGDKTLDDICIIKGGLATLRNKIYIHENKKFNEPCWREVMVSSKRKWIIYPYDYRGKILCEDCLKTNNPLTYKFLEENKEELSKRDNGKKTYPSWYAYGRQHNLNLSKSENLIYISTFINPEVFPYEIDHPMLYSGCITIDLKKDSVYTLENVLDILKKKETKDFIINNCSKRNNNWINLSPRILKKVSL